MSTKKHESVIKVKSKGQVVKDDKTGLTEMAGKIEETDEMKLKMLAAVGKPEPEDLLYPPELNAHLLEQLKVMTAENTQLRKMLFTKDQQLKELNKTVADLNNRIRDIITSSGPTVSSKSAGIISAKITELCKQNRHLVAEVEGYKTKNAALERKIMQIELLNQEHEKLDICVCHENPPDVVTPDELKELNMKLAAVNKRLCDSKKKNLELKNEIIAATRILQQELGDKFTSLKELQNDVIGWKGRAEKIVLLQAKINDLEEKLNLKQKEADPKKMDQGQIIKEIEAKRKKEMEQALKDYKLVKDENHDLKKKLEAAKCRTRNLECDATIIRQKMQTFMEKSNADDMLINEQRNQIKALELYYQDILKENTIKINKMHNEIIEYQKLNKNIESKVDALRKQATEKAAKIEELRAQLLRYEECSLQSVFFTPMRTATDNEIQRLTELVVKQNERIDAERNKWEELEASHRKLKEKKRRLEKRLALLEEELKFVTESKRGSRASKSSLPKEHHEFSMPMKDPSVTKKKSQSVATIAEKPSESTTTESQQDSYEYLDKDELRYKLELTDEKLKILEDKLKMVEEEKQEDYIHLTEMIQNSKQLFNEALMVLQKEKCICN